MPGTYAAGLKSVGKKQLPNSNELALALNSYEDRLCRKLLKARMETHLSELAHCFGRGSGREPKPD